MIDLASCFTYAYSLGTQADFFQAVNTAEEVSTNTIDLGVVGIRIGGVKPPWIIGRVGVAMDVSTTIEIKLITSTAAALNAGVKAVKAWHFTAAQMAANTLVINEPLGHFDYQRYLGLEFSCQGTGDATTFCAYLSEGPEPAVTDIALTEATP